MAQSNGIAGPAFPSLVDQFGRDVPSTADPAFQPIGDPTRDIGQLRARVRVIHREIPNVVVEQSWTPHRVRDAIIDLVIGLFDRPAQLHDAIVGDSRMQSALRQRAGGLLGRPISFKPPAKLKNDATAIKCCKVWERHWPQMNAEPALLELVETKASLGFSYSQLLWDTVTSQKYWKPYLQSFNARYAWYHWLLRCHVAVTLDGQAAITPGDGHWVVHGGEYRSWMRGTLRAVAQWWLARGYALRDWARYCERHGFPIILLDTPFGADPQDIATAQGQLVNLGQEDVFQTPGSVDINKYGKYDLRYLEPKDRNWQAFKELIGQCSDEITLALLGQNLTSEVKEGSLAAARVHADVRQAILESDARELARTLYVQVLRPFAALNFGDARYAPTVQWDVRPQEDLEQKARTFQAFATALNQLRQAGLAIRDVGAFARRFGLRGLDAHDVDPVQVEARLAQATGKADNAAQPELDADTKAYVEKVVHDEIQRAQERRRARKASSRKTRLDRAA